VSDRDAFREAREHGLKARHETREARAVRREVANEIADALAARAKIAQRAPVADRSGVREGMIVTWLAAEKLAREFAKEATDA
jgi:hypothetical protein